MELVKEITDIIFFKYTDGLDKGKVETAVFYNDGSKKHFTYEDGLGVVTALAKKKGISSKEAFKQLINNDLVHVMTINDFKANYDKFVALSKNSIKAVIDEEVNSLNDDLEIYNKPRTVENHYTVVKEKDNSLKYKLAAGGLAIALLASGTSYALTKGHYEGKVLAKSNKETSQDVNENSDTNNTANNEAYNDYSFEELLAVTQNETQKAEMQRIHDALVDYNVEFAKHYIESDKDIKAALSWDEMVALSQAYNDFTPAEIKAIFNGTTIKATDLDNAYKTGTLQLMGAHVIEDRAHPVDMSKIIVDEEGKAFYNKYHELFLTAKEANGDNKIKAVEAFYSALRKDFPITADVREEGISHADPRASLESYKLAVTPMVAAAEIMWQNLEVDHTLKGGVADYFLDFAEFEGLTREDLASALNELNNGVHYGDLDYFNDLGLCNFANEKFEIIQQVTMGDCGNYNKANPTYEQFKNATIIELKAKDAYVIDDAHRDLSGLDKFQDTVNWHFEIDDEGYYTGKTWYSTETRTVTKKWSKSKTTYRTETKVVKKAIPASEKAKIDKEIEKENQKAKAEGEKKAEENRQEMQKEEDKKAEEVKKEVEQDAKDMQDKIDNANDKINENNKDNDTSNDKPVNESDFGDHNVDFDDNHSDSNGNLDDSVENITTDGSNAHEAGNTDTGANLPDPEDTAKDYEERTKNQVQASEAAAPKKSAPAPKQEAAPAPKSTSNAAAVDKYVEELANTSDNDDSEKTKVKE